ncbi:malate:quinone oxidoreductase, partial [Staphylococcus saprophyticus]|uniref:malate:quinone oxidoreductase n=1 Tax=Staphylococcus saprophyticus TaxID=29385 RepID=UPI00164263C2
PHQTSHHRHNAPTPHPALSQFNYTLTQPHPSINIHQPKQINQQFQLSKQFSTHLLQNKTITNPQQFIPPLPHITFLTPKNNLQFLKHPYQPIKEFPMFHNIE